MEDAHILRYRLIRDSDRSDGLDAQALDWERSGRRQVLWVSLLIPRGIVASIQHSDQRLDVAYLGRATTVRISNVGQEDGAGLVCPCVSSLQVGVSGGVDDSIAVSIANDCDLEGARDAR